jgi:hypothetical protein
MPVAAETKGAARPPEEGGRGGIRTHGRVAPPTVFKTVAFVRSATLPGSCYLRKRSRPLGLGHSVAAKLSPVSALTSFCESGYSLTLEDHGLDLVSGEVLAKKVTG